MLRLRLLGLLFLVYANIRGINMLRLRYFRLWLLGFGYLAFCGWRVGLGLWFSSPSNRWWFGNNRFGLSLGGFFFVFHLG